MKLLHTSDWHLGIDLHKHSLIEDQRFFIDQLCQAVEEEEIDVVLISGDIYDTTLASKEAIELFDEAMRRLCKDLQRKVVVIAGNHDSQTRLAVMKELLKDSGLYVYGTLDGPIEPLIIEDVELYPIPFLHKETISRIYQRSFLSYEQAFLYLMEEIRKQRKTRPQIVLAHAFVNGASLSESDRFAMVGGSDLISKDVFNEFAYVALGHLHQPQILADHVRYSGSPLAYAFSETKPKQMWIYDTSTGVTTERYITPLHPLVTLQGTYDEVLSQLPNVQDAYVKIVLQDVPIQYELLQFLRERCPYLLSLQGLQQKEIQEVTTMDVEALDQLRDEELIMQFFQDYYDRTITEEELQWFEEAKEGEAVCA